jgi:hypothetical protein
MMLGQMHAIETHVIGRLVEGDAIIEQLGEIGVRATDMVEKTYFHDVPGFSSCLAALCRPAMFRGLSILLGTESDQYDSMVDAAVWPMQFL